MSVDIASLAKLQFAAGAGSRERAPSIQKLTQEFESIFLTQMLAVMRESVGSEGLFEGSTGQDIYDSMMDQALAKALASQGGIGLAGPLLRHLEGLDGEAGTAADNLGEAAVAVPGAAPEHVHLDALGRRLQDMVANFEVTSRPGWRRDPFTDEWAFHRGLDLAAPEGTEVLSATPGRVVFSGEQGGYGKTVIVEDRGNRVRYAHLKDIHVNEGEEVKAGQQLGEVGSTGRSTGPHLHLEVEKR